VWHKGTKKADRGGGNFQTFQLSQLSRQGFTQTLTLEKSKKLLTFPRRCGGSKSALYGKGVAKIQNYFNIRKYIARMCVIIQRIVNFLLNIENYGK
jgi:hypothetical protein